MEKKAIRIRGTRNIAIAIGIQICIWASLWAASQVSLLWALAIGGIGSFVLLTNYALMHEAAHHVFHRSPRANYAFGVLTSALFPMAFTLFEVTHHVHHRGNRTDPELFDYYYPDENRFVKSVQWYGILTGLYYPFVPLGSLIMAAIPWIYQTPIFTRRRTFRVLLKEFVGRNVLLVRIEVLFSIALWVGLWQLLSLEWAAVAIVYACFGFNWSTRQFVTHAWSPRDVLEGANNLVVSPLTGAVLLNGQWDHVHHKFPYLPWTELADIRYHEKEPLSYLRQYLSLWRGIRPNTEPEPMPIPDIEAHPEITYV